MLKRRFLSRLWHPVGLFSSREPWCTPAARTSWALTPAPRVHRAGGHPRAGAHVDTRTCARTRARSNSHCLRPNRHRARRHPTRTAVMLAALALTFDNDLHAENENEQEHNDADSTELNLRFEFGAIRGVWTTALKSTGIAADARITLPSVGNPKRSVRVNGHGPLVHARPKNMRDAAQLWYPARTQTSLKRVIGVDKENVSI
ncbi:hypothetical protein B0H14DRAFT_1362857 [Mycena olivaceomarginata]|nr:hypothetical protein B0H14DRAFT_1362857 [Mycena olivaceomarginata]